MKKKFTLVLSALLIAGLAWDHTGHSAIGNSGGISTPSTGSPGDGQTCANSGCHVGGPAQTNETVVFSTNVPETGYVGGTTYDITVEAQGPAGQKFGFQMSPQDDAGNALGTLIASDVDNTQLVGSEKYITHKAAGTVGTGSRTWNFQWTAPAIGTGDVMFYGGFNFANNDATPNGDVIVAESFRVLEDLTAGVNDLDATNLSVYTNPVIDVVNIALKDVDEEIMVTLYAVDGRPVHQKTYTQNLIRVDVEAMDLNAGIYLLQLEVAGNSTVKKLLVK